MRRKPKAKVYLRFRTLEWKQSRTVRLSSTTSPVFVPSGALLKVSRNCTATEPIYRRAKRDGEWKWESVGNDANTAYAKLDVPPIVPLKAAGKNEAAAPTVKDGFRIDDEIAVYLSNVSKLSPKTYKAYTRSLELFRQSCKKIYVHQITKQDLQAFDTAPIEEGNEDRTRHNRVQHVVTFLRNEEGRRPGPPIKDDGGLNCRKCKRNGGRHGSYVRSGASVQEVDSKAFARTSRPITTRRHRRGCNRARVQKRGRGDSCRRGNFEVPS